MVNNDLDFTLSREIERFKKTYSNGEVYDANIPHETFDKSNPILAIGKFNDYEKSKKTIAKMAKVATESLLITSSTDKWSFLKNSA